jgi:hypothetical protein
LYLRKLVVFYAVKQAASGFFTNSMDYGVPEKNAIALLVNTLSVGIPLAPLFEKERHSRRLALIS